MWLRQRPSVYNAREPNAAGGTIWSSWLFPVGGPPPAQILAAGLCVATATASATGLPSARLQAGNNTALISISATVMASRSLQASGISVSVTDTASVDAFRVLPAGVQSVNAASTSPPVIVEAGINAITATNPVASIAVIASRPPDVQPTGPKPTPKPRTSRRINPRATKRPRGRR